VIREVRHDASVRVLIVTGAGDRAFVAGADIAAMSKMSASDGLDSRRLGHRVMESFEDLPIPLSRRSMDLRSAADSSSRSHPT